jgi:hypothetical protein
MSFSGPVTPKLSSDLACGMDQALTLLVDGLRALDFGVVAKWEVASQEDPLPAGFTRCSIVRAFFPRIHDAAQLVALQFENLIRCNAVLVEMGPRRVHIELSKPTRLLNGSSPELKQQAIEADQRLEQLLKRLQDETSESGYAA